MAGAPGAAFVAASLVLIVTPGQDMVLVVSRAIIRQSRNVFLVSDLSKLGRSAPVRLASLSEIDIVFTDRAFPPDLMRRCAEWQTEVRIA